MDWNEDEYETVLRQFQPRKPSLPGEMLTAPPRRRGLWIAAAAVILLGALSISILRNPQVVDAHAVVEAIDGSLVRVSGENPRPVAIGESVDAGEIVRSEGSRGAALALKDGTRFEVRSQSEFSVERTDEGLRINLLKGSLIIDAEKQIDRRLSVKTKDLLVFSVGAVFLVSVEEKGSRVAALEGEVRVQQGVMARNLGPGEQLATNPQMELLPVTEEIAWSRQATSLLRSLQESRGLPPVPTLYHSEERLAFEVVSVRASSTVPRGEPGSPESWCPGTVQSNVRRFYARNISIYQLILLAYRNGDCESANRLGLLSGGPEWVKLDRFDIEAILPDDIPPVPGQSSDTAADRRLEKMLQSLLSDRFRLVLRREMKVVPDAKGPVEVLSIERVERPFAN